MRLYLITVIYSDRGEEYIVTHDKLPNIDQRLSLQDKDYTIEELTLVEEGIYDVIT